MLRYVNSLKVSYPIKRREAAQSTAPFRTSDGGAETSLHREDSGLLLRSVPDYSDTNPQAVHPECGGNAPAIPEHHRKRSAAPTGRMRPPPAVPELQNKDPRLETSRLSEVGTTETLTRGRQLQKRSAFTRVLHASCVPEECLYETRLDTPPPL